MYLPAEFGAIFSAAIITFDQRKEDRFGNWNSILSWFINSTIDIDFFCEMFLRCVDVLLPNHVAKLSQGVSYKKKLCVSKWFKDPYQL